MVMYTRIFIFYIKYKSKQKICGDIIFATPIVI